VNSAQDGSQPLVGFQLTPDFLSAAEEESLLALVAGWKLKRIQMRGGFLRRQMLCFGADFGANFIRLHDAPPIPRGLRRLRERCAALGGYRPALLTQAIVQRYPAGAGIGWHRDAQELGPVVIGVSLGSDATLKFALERSSRAGVMDIALPARSAYVMAGEARYRWLHCLASVTQTRISITFRAASI
jgi:DNA oxidative demethylase